jgi:hypothetical protein
LALAWGFSQPRGNALTSADCVGGHENTAPDSEALRTGRRALHGMKSLPVTKSNHDSNVGDFAALVRWQSSASATPTSFIESQLSDSSSVVHRKSIPAWETDMDP